jgi:hypothetical protein
MFREIVQYEGHSLARFRVFLLRSVIRARVKEDDMDCVAGVVGIYPIKQFDPARE